MSTNPVVRAERVIDTKGGVRRPLEFLHTRVIRNQYVSHSAAVQVGDEWHINITNSNLKLGHFAVVVLPSTLLTASIYKNAFVLDSSGPKLRLVAAVQPTESFTIPTILLIEVDGDSPSSVQGLINSEGSGSGTEEFDWVYDSTKLSVFGQYLANLGQVQAQIDQIKAFLIELSKEAYIGNLSADVIQTGTITADKFEVNSKNLLSRFDSFENYNNIPILGPSLGINLAQGTNLDKFHGDISLLLEKGSGVDSFYKFINPFENSNSGWININQTTTYTFSVYVKNRTSSPINLSLQLIKVVDTTETVVLTTSQATNLVSSNGWVRLTGTATLTNKDFLSLKILGTGQLAAVVEFLVDGIQLEKSNSVTDFKSSGRILIEGGNISSDSILTEHITAEAINADKIKAGSIETDKLAANSITADKIQTNAITTDKLNASAITADKIATNAITTEKLDALSVTAEKIAADAVTANKILAGSITTAKLDALAVTAEKIAADAVTANKILAGSVTAVKIAANAIETDKIQASAVIAEKIATDAITADKILAGSITATKIATDAVTADKILAGSITATKIAVDSIDATKIQTDAITANKIKAGELNATHLKTEFGNISSLLKVGPIGSEVVIDGTTSNGKIYTGAGNHGGATTGLYLDSTGKFSLSNQLIFTPGSGDTLSELEVSGTIRGIIDSATPIPNNKLSTTITNIVVSSNIGTVNTGTHAFTAGEKVLIENMTNNNLNGQYTILTTPTTTSFTITTSGVSNGTYMGTSPIATLKELTMGFHAAEGTGTDWERSAGSGIRLDKHNWWLTNNQFRVGGASSHIKWNGDTLDIKGSGTKTLKLGVGSGDASNYFSIVNNGSTPTYNNSNTPFYAGGSGNFSLGDKLTWDGSSLNITGTIKQSSTIETAAGNFTANDTLDYNLNITGGTRSFIYDKDGLNPSPSSTAYTVESRIGTTVWTSDKLTIAWTAAGRLSGTSSTTTFTPAINSTFTTAYTYVQVSVSFYTSSAKTTLLKTVVETTPVSITKIGDTGLTGDTGATGAAGRGISSTAITYQASSSGTVVPTGTWLSSPPSVSPSQYLWTRTVITYTDATTSTSYSVGQMGATGNTGAAGRGISSTAVTYQAHSSGTDVPSGTWLSNPPTVSAGQYLWTRTIITYTDSTTSTSYSIGRMGEQGPQGVKGDTGDIGPTGPSGPGIVYRGEWSAAVQYFSTAERRDVVLYSGSYYVAKTTHTNSTPPNTTNWEAFGATFTSIATGLLLTEDAFIKRTLTLGTNAAGNSANITINGNTNTPYLSMAQSSIGYGNAGTYIGSNGLSLVSSNALNFLKWNGSTLEISGDTVIGSKTITETLNGKNRTFVSESQPIEAIQGDLWYSLDEEDPTFPLGLYSYTGTSWIKIEDIQNIETLEIANNALFESQDKAVVRFGSLPNTPYKVNDLWIDNAGSIYKCITEKTEAQSSNINDWVAATKYTDNTELEAYKTTVSSELNTLSNRITAKVEESVYSSFVSSVNSSLLELTPDKILLGLNQHLTGIDGSSLVTTSTLALTSASIEANFQAISNLDTLINTNFTFDASGLSIRKEGSSNYISIDNDSVDFFYNNNLIADISSVEGIGTMNITNAILTTAKVAQTIDIGSHRMRNYTVGSDTFTLFEWIGGTA
jgi:hypothetical protein